MGYLFKNPEFDNHCDFDCPAEHCGAHHHHHGHHGYYEHHEHCGHHCHPHMPPHPDTKPSEPSDNNCDCVDYSGYGENAFQTVPKDLLGQRNSRTEISNGAYGDSSIAVGFNAKVYGDDSYAGGNGSINYVGENAFIHGFENKGYAHQTVIFGGNNTAGAEDAEVTVGYSAFINGTNNWVKGTHSTAFGMFNENFGDLCFINGTNNKIPGGHVNVIQGSNNLISYGAFNEIVGSTNNLYDAERTTVRGDSNSGYGTAHTRIGGDNNSVSAAKYVDVLGSSNVLDTVIRGSVNGCNNTILSSDEPDITGDNNRLNKAIRTSIIGGSNFVEEFTDATKIVGHRNNIADTACSTVIGDSNIADSIIVDAYVAVTQSDETSTSLQFIGGWYVEGEAKIPLSVHGHATIEVGDKIRLFSDYGSVQSFNNSQDTVFTVTEVYTETPASTAPYINRIKVTPALNVSNTDWAGSGPSGGVPTIPYVNFVGITKANNTPFETRGTTIIGAYNKASNTRNGLVVGYKNFARPYIPQGINNSNGQTEGDTAQNKPAILLGSNLLGVNGQAVLGDYNKPMASTSDAVLSIGNGYSPSGRSNAFRVTSSGSVYAAGSFNASSAGWGEMYEWEDGNPDNEDRVGLFVTFGNGRTIKPAKAGDLIIGITSVSEALITNNPEDWHNKYLTDNFGRIIYEDVIVPEEMITVQGFDDNGTSIVTTEVIPEHVIKAPKFNPDYDPTQDYIARSDRPEYACVCCGGQVRVKADSTVVPGGYCTISENGIATTAEAGANTYYVTERQSDDVVWVYIK